MSLSRTRGSGISSNMSYTRCAAPNCSTRHGQGKIFKGFPKGRNLKELWLKNLPIGFDVKPNAAFCELHFELTEFERLRQDGKKKLKANATPSIFILTQPQCRAGPTLGDITNRSRNEEAVIAPVTSTPLRPRQQRIKHEDHPYFRRREGKENSTHDSFELSFVEACHLARSVRSEDSDSRTKVLATEKKSDFCQTSCIEPCSDILSSIRKIRELDESEPYTYLEESVNITSLDISPNNDNVQVNLFNCDNAMEEVEVDPILDHSDVLVCPFTGILQQTPGDRKEQSQLISVPKSELEEALEKIKQQNQKIKCLEEEAHNRTIELQQAKAASNSLSKILHVTSMDSETVPISSISVKNVLSLIANQALEIDNLKSVSVQREVLSSALRKAVDNAQALKKKYLAQRRVTERLNLKLNSKTFSRWLTPGQQKILLRKSTRGLKWEPEMIRKGLILKMACGSTGYCKLVQDLPLYPSVRCLQQSVQFIQFQSGMLDHMFDLLEAYGKHCSDFERDCQIVVDELALEEGQHYDPSTKTIVGDATFPTHTGLAQKGLVIMLAGITKRWKISVAVYFTSERAPEFKPKKGHHDDENHFGKAFLKILLEVAKRAEAINFRVAGITSDMGPDNQALWKAAGVNASRKEDSVQSLIPHPSRSGFLAVTPDIVHAFKSLKNGMENNLHIFLDEDLVKEENLPSAVVDYNHIQDLYEFEEKNELKVAFRLRPDNIKVTNQYLKMRTSTTKAVLCHRTGVGLQLMAKAKKNDSYLTTAWFVILLNTFFELMTGRCKRMSLNRSNKTMYDEAIKLIKKVDRVFRTMKVGSKGEFKPFQKAFRLLCASILWLQQYFFEERHYSYLMLGRFCQDCLENLFSMIRMRQPIPHALAFLQCLKAITLAQYAMAIKNSNYDYEESESMFQSFDFLETARKRAIERANEKFFETLDELFANPVPKLTPYDIEKYLPEWEQNVTYDMAGSTIAQIKKMNYIVCEVCMKATQLRPDQDHQKACLVDAKEFTLLRKKNSSGLRRLQIYVTDVVFKALVTAEVTFRMLRHKTLRFKNADVQKYFVENLMYVWDGSGLPTCHNIGRKILDVYFKGRVKEHLRSGRQKLAEKKKTKSVNRSSKTAGMHDAAAKVKPASQRSSSK